MQNEILNEKAERLSRNSAQEVSCGAYSESGDDDVSATKQTLTIRNVNENTTISEFI